MMILKLTYKETFLIRKELESIIEASKPGIEVNDTGKDIEVRIIQKDSRAIAIKFFTLFLNHSEIQDIRFKRQ